MPYLTLILLVFAFVLAVIAATIMETSTRWHFGWAAIAFWIAAELVSRGAGVLH